jgi:hypothetical protein
MLDVRQPELAPVQWSERVRALYEHWLTLHPATSRFPGRQHFDPLKVAGLMPWVWMVDVVHKDAHPRFRYRLLGTKHVQALGRDYTGWWMDEAHPAFSSPSIFAHYLSVASGEVSWRRGQPGFQTQRDFVFEMERVMLPMARDGVTVDLILAITVYFRADGKELT